MSRGKRSRGAPPCSPASGTEATSRRRAPAGAAAPAGRAESRPGWLSWALGGVLLVVVVAVVAVAASSGGGLPAGTDGPSAGNASGTPTAAPNGTFTTTGRTAETVAALRGRPTLLWFVTTWCSSCQAGTQAMSAEIPHLSDRHVRVVELELAGDLGEPGPTITTFARQLAGGEYHSPDWTFGTASPALTETYDPHGYLDVYYLLNAAGQITYANSSPAATMPQLLAAIGKIAQHA
jgi:cytochrome oxidase Cu insertion factor (SCO1/SenC/PrrC family)